MPRYSEKLHPGSRVGMLTVLTDSGRRKNGYIIWHCQCDCGNEIDVDKRTLLRGTVQDCGCKTTIKPGQSDISGQRFGLLIAKYPLKRKSKNGSYYWHCICDCGGEIDAPLTQLTHGYRKSCNCLSKPPMKEYIGVRFGKLVAISYAGKRAGMHRWKCKCDCGNETIVGQTLLQTGKTKSCGCIQQTVYVDNLKLTEGTSVALLERLQKGCLPNNTSGQTGVYLNKKSNRWVAEIRFQGKYYYLGSYSKKEDAIKARKNAEEMHSDFLERYYEDHIQNKSSS